MSHSETPPTPPPLQSPPRDRLPSQFQFSVRSLLLSITVLAVALTLQRVVGPRFVQLALSVWIIVVVTALGTLALYCRGHRRTLFLGAFIASLGTLFTGAQVTGLFGFACYQLVAALVGGVTALATRRQLERRGWHLAGD